MLNDPEIERLLENFRPAALHSADETVYVLRPDLQLAYVNLGWMRFAARNGGEPRISLKWSIGRCVLDAIAPILRPFFAENLGKCLREGRPWKHHYDCSSADLSRAFMMTTYPLGNAEGLLVINSVEQESAHTRSPHEPLEVLYQDELGLIKQCCHCRRVQRTGPEPSWDWVPDWVKSPPPRTSHGVCEPCFGSYYPTTPRFRKSLPEAFQTRE